MECLEKISITLAGLSLGRSSLQFPRIKSLWSSSSCVPNVFESLQFVERFFLRGGREDRFQFDAAAEDSFLVAFRPLLATRSTRSLPKHLYASLAPTWSRSASISIFTGDIHKSGCDYHFSALSSLSSVDLSPGYKCPWRHTRLTH